MNKKELDLIQKLLEALNIAIDRSDLETGDTFGMHHNEVMDAMDEAAAVIAKEREWLTK